MGFCYNSIFLVWTIWNARNDIIFSSSMTNMKELEDFFFFENGF